MLLPLRFRTGGTGSTTNMAPIPTSVHHHHRSTTKQSQKPFKSRFASKNALKDLAKGTAYTINQIDQISNKTPREGGKTPRRPGEASDTSPAGHVQNRASQSSPSVANSPS